MYDNLDETNFFSEDLYNLIKMEEEHIIQFRAKI